MRTRPYLRCVDYLLALSLGIAVAFFGILLPGLVNMTAVSVSVKRGRRAGLQFIAGGSIVVIFQAFVALIFADVLQQDPTIVDGMKKFAVWLFIILGVGFFWKAQTGQVVKARKTGGGRIFFAGIGMATANALAIPYFLAMSSFLMAKGHVTEGLLSIGLFSFGAGLGSLVIYVAYVWSADWVSRHAAWLTRNINYIMSGFFFILAILQGYNIYC